MLDISVIRDKRALVVGDIIIDYYRILKEKRLSPECPVIIFEPVEEDVRAGGAMNVANSLAALRMDVSFFSVGGADLEDYSNFIRSMPFQTKINRSEFRKMTVKERLVTRRQAITRIDHQKTLPLEKHEADNLFVDANRELKDNDVLVFSDYEHGVLVPELVRNLIDSAKVIGKPVVVNTKAKDYMKYKNSDVIILNMNEAKAITHLNNNKNNKVAEFLFDCLECKEIVLTMGAEGILVFDKDGPASYPIVGAEDEVIDVTGAGDTVTSLLAAGVAVGYSAKDLAGIANVAADQVIKKRGTSTVTLEELMERISI